jgi:hypothetical protein
VAQGTSLRRATAETKRIDNTPDQAAVGQLTQLARVTLEGIRKICGGHPVIVSSGYRCRELNEAVGGASNSAHLYGCATPSVPRATSAWRSPTPCSTAPLYTEYNIGHFSRAFTLSHRIDQQQIGATLNDGVLTVTLKKVQQPQPRRIQIQ